MAYQIHIITNEIHDWVPIGPKGRCAKPYVYHTREDACLAIRHIKDGMRLAGYDVDSDLVYKFVAVAS